MISCSSKNNLPTTYISKYNQWSRRRWAKIYTSLEDVSTRKWAMLYYETHHVPVWTTFPQPTTIKKTEITWGKIVKNIKKKNVKGKSSNARALVLHLGDGLETWKMNSCLNFLTSRICGCMCGYFRKNMGGVECCWNEENPRRSRSLGREERREREMGCCFLSPHGENGLPKLQKEIIY